MIPPGGVPRVWWRGQQALDATAPRRAKFDLPV
jgi:hypothetical protein